MRRSDRSMSGSTTQLGAESGEAPAVLQRQEALVGPIAELVATIRNIAPPGRDLRARKLRARRNVWQALVRAPPRHSGVRRGAEHRVDLSTGSLAIRDQLFLAISRQAAARTLSRLPRWRRRRVRSRWPCVNDTNSPLARACEFVLPMEAGPELSIAASKSFLASLAVLLRLTASWKDDVMMRRSFHHLPERLGRRNRTRLVNGGLRSFQRDKRDADWPRSYSRDCT